MGFFLLLLSLLFIVKGVLLIMAPKKVLKFANYFFNSKEPKAWAIGPLVIGILLLFSVTSSILGWLIALLGIFEIAMAVYIFLTPMAKLKVHPWLNLSDNGNRAMGIFLLVLGVIIFISRI
ncbi:MAG TPA: hypothetical protein PLU24_04550 [Candidatus Omnitrophota bacterium]|nr:hypothetical protein [Candidatus Omnitrophota bacterium]